MPWQSKHLLWIAHTASTVCVVGLYKAVFTSVTTKCHDCYLLTDIVYNWSV